MPLPRHQHPPLPTSPVARRASFRWLLTALSGMAVCMTLEASHHFIILPPVLHAWLPMTAGLAIVLILAPWRMMNALHTDSRREVRSINRQLRKITDNDRTQPLADLILDRDDELGELSNLIHNLATETTTVKQQSRLVQRRMDHSIERETRRATAHLERQVATDPLTGLGNRRAMDQRLLELLRERAPGRLEMTIMAIDLDRFKEVNDSLGHEVGDQCLIFLADVLRAGLRREDCPIRLGGDEFIVVMPDGAIEEGRTAARRLASLFAQMPWPHRSAPRPTLSFGLACDVVSSTDNCIELLRRADVALYQSKQAGRNAVSEYGQERNAA